MTEFIFIANFWVRNTDGSEGKPLAKGIISRYNEGSRPGLIAPLSDPKTLVGFRLSNVSPPEMRHLVLPGQEVRFGTRKTRKGMEATWVVLVVPRRDLPSLPAPGNRIKALVEAYDFVQETGYFFLEGYEEVEMPATEVHRSKGRNHLRVGHEVSCLVESQNGRLVATDIWISSSVAQRRRVRA